MVTYVWVEVLAFVLQLLRLLFVYCCCCCLFVAVVVWLLGCFCCLWLLFGYFKRVETCYGGIVADGYLVRYLVRYFVYFFVQIIPSFLAF